MGSQFKYIGKSFERPDAENKINGKTKYAPDLKLHNMLHGKLITSKKAHAKVTIDSTAAMQVDGVVAVYTHADVPKRRYNSDQWYSGAKHAEDEYILHEEAKFVGDRIALVLAETLAAAERAANLIQVKYEELPVDLEVTLDMLEPAAADDKRLCFQKAMGCGDVSAGFEKADYIIEDIGTTPKVHHAAIENYSCVSELDMFGNLVLYAPCQVVFQVQHIMARALGLPYDKIRVIKTFIGGSFGGKGVPTLEPLCGFATLKTGRPVKIVMERHQSISSTRTRNPSTQRIRTGVTKDGKIVARDIKVAYNGGAYLTNGAGIVGSSGKKAFRIYDIENQHFFGQTYYSNTTPGGACRGYGSPQIHSITEINISNAARKLGIDPVDFRIMNAFEPQPFVEGAVDQIGRPGIGNSRIKDCLVIGKREFNWAERIKKIKEKETDRYAYGMGVAIGSHGNGYSDSFPDYTNVYIQMMPDGQAFAKIAVHDMGCGTILSMQQIAAEVLDIHPSLINIPEADTFISPYDAAGTQASRVTYVCGAALQNAAELLKEKIFACYADKYNCPIEAISVTDGVVSAANCEPMNYGQIAIYSEDKLHTTLKVELEYEPKANPAVGSVCFSEVKVDKYMGFVEIEDMLIVQDAGRVINYTQAVGQVQGGTQMSIGMALYEEILYDDKGNLKSENFSKYHIVNAPSMPDIRVVFVEEGEPLGPFGAKSLGELASVAPAPSILNAINHALGVNLTAYPATPERVIAALEGQAESYSGIKLYRELSPCQK